MNIDILALHLGTNRIAQKCQNSTCFSEKCLGQKIGLLFTHLGNFLKHLGYFLKHLGNFLIKLSGHTANQPLSASATLSGRLCLSVSPPIGQSLVSKENKDGFFIQSINISYLLKLSRSLVTRQRKEH